MEHKLLKLIDKKKSKRNKRQKSKKKLQRKSRKKLLRKKAVVQKLRQLPHLKRKQPHQLLPLRKSQFKKKT